MADHGTPEWWIERLEAKRRAALQRYEKLNSYATGNHPLPEGDDRARELFRKFQRKARTNYCGLVASAVTERLQVDGFRSGSDGDSITDAESWGVWQRNNLDADADLVHRAAVSMSEAYVLVGFDGTAPIITPEDPRLCAVETDPLNRRIIRAGLKTWDDTTAKKSYAVLYLPTTVHYFTSDISAVKKWAETGPDFTGAAQPAVNPIGVVPFVRFVARPQLDGTGMAEFEDAIDVQDRINDGVLNRLVIAKMQTYRQRWVKGLPSEDEEGNPLDLPFVPGVDMLWSVDADPGEVEFGEFQQAELRPLLEATRDDVTAFITLTGLPPHYVSGDLVNASADALAAAEARLVAKVRALQRTFGEAWEQVLALAARWENRALPADTEVIWSDPERKTDAQLSDAAVKKMAAGVPWEQRMEDMKYTPTQIARMQSARAVDLLLNDVQPVNSAATVA